MVGPYSSEAGHGRSVKTERNAANKKGIAGEDCAHAAPLSVGVACQLWLRVPARIPLAHRRESAALGATESHLFRPQQLTRSTPASRRAGRHQAHAGIHTDGLRKAKERDLARIGEPVSIGIRLGIIEGHMVSSC